MDYMIALMDQTVRIGINITETKLNLFETV